MIIKVGGGLEHLGPIGVYATKYMRASEQQLPTSVNEMLESFPRRLFCIEKTAVFWPGRGTSFLLVGHAPALSSYSIPSYPSPLSFPIWELGH